MKKLAAILLTLALIFAFASCGAKNNETTTAEDTSAAETTGEITTEAATEAKETESVTDISETSAEEQTTQEEKSKIPQTDEEILAAYTKVMNKAKNDKAGFTLSEWQELPSDPGSRVISKGNTLVGAALNVANNFMTSEEDAKAKPTVYEKGGDMAAFPIRNTPYGCTLKDISALKSIKCEELSNGNVKITLVLKDEMNPEPAPAGSGNSPSNTGKVITPLSKSEIDEKLNGGIVSAVAKDINYSLLFHDVTSTVVYNPETDEIVSLNQTTRVTVSGSGKIAGMEIVVDKQELVNNKEITNLKY
ncbi:MAG: hypothetical protein IKR90_02710 [Clostridia bacterium]|nr:hypothetical protein [Clostridia bacterium]